MRKLLALAMIFALSGCANSHNTSSYTIAQSDVTAISVDTPANFSAKRVVVLANGVAEIMNSLNATSIIVGRDISSTEAELEDIPVVTSGHQVLPEIVIGLKPDLVIIDSSSGPKAALDQIRVAGIRIVQTPEIWKVGDIGIKVAAVAEAIGAPQQGVLLNDALNTQIQASTIKGQPHVAFLYLRGTSSIYLIGGPGSGADSLISSVGAIDVGAQSLTRPFNTLTAESLATLNPDVLIVMTKGLESVGGVSGLLKLPGVAQTKAGKNSAVIDVDDSLLLSFGPRTPSLVQQLALALQEVIK